MKKRFHPVWGLSPFKTDGYRRQTYIQKCSNRSVNQSNELTGPHTFSALCKIEPSSGKIRLLYRYQKSITQAYCIKFKYRISIYTINAFFSWSLIVEVRNVLRIQRNLVCHHQKLLGPVCGWGALPEPRFTSQHELLGVHLQSSRHYKV